MFREIGFSMLALLCASATLGEQPSAGTPGNATAAKSFQRPVFASDGTVHVPAFDLPPSTFASKEVTEGLKYAAQLKQAGSAPPSDIKEARAQMEAMLAPMVGMMQQKYPVDIEAKKFAGVSTRIFTPKNQPYDKERVLINLHGGAFSVCAESCAMLESIPVSSVGGFKVVSVDYRMAPEYKHPAGLEDVVAVYRELLKSYEARHIGIYGCSAGGSLSAHTAAWLTTHNLPQAGAIGIFGAGAARFGTGDSAYLSAYIDGNFAPPQKGESVANISPLTRGYFDGADMNDSILSPAQHLDVLAKFPPSLVITGSRAMDMSPAIYTNSQLLKAGVDSTLIVGEALGHCYLYAANLPESQDAYAVISRFFKKNLK